MTNYKTSIVHFENGDIIFETSIEFINFMKVIFKENEIDNIEPCDKVLRQIETYEECLIYLIFYCGNFELLNTTFLNKN